MEVGLAEIKLRARRWIGAISRGLERAEHRLNKGPTTGTPTKNQILKAAGLSTSGTNRCKKIAEILSLSKISEGK